MSPEAYRVAANIVGAFPVSVAVVVVGLVLLTGWALWVTRRHQPRRRGYIVHVPIPHRPELEASYARQAGAVSTLDRDDGVGRDQPNVDQPPWWPWDETTPPTIDR